MQAVTWVLGLLYGGFVVAFVLGWIPLIVAVPIVVVVFLLYVPLVRVDDELRLVTDRSPERVREDFQSVDNPLAVFARALADEDGVERNENGGTYVTTRFFGLHTTRTRYEAEQCPNGDLRVRSEKNGSESTVSTVRVESDGTGSRVTVEGGRSGRMSLRTLLLFWVRYNRLAAAFEAYGYEPVDANSRFGLR